MLLSPLQAAKASRSRTADLSLLVCQGHLPPQFITMLYIYMSSICNGFTLLICPRSTLHQIARYHRQQKWLGPTAAWICHTEMSHARPVISSLVAPTSVSSNKGSSHTKHPPTHPRQCANVKWPVLTHCFVSRWTNTGIALALWWKMTAR